MECPSADEWIKKTWCVRTVEYLFSLKVRKEILTHAATRVSLEDTTLREISQSQKTDAMYFHLCEVPGVIKVIATESEMVVARGRGQGRRGSLFNVSRV